MRWAELRSSDSFGTITRAGTVQRGAGRRSRLVGLHVLLIALFVAAGAAFAYSRGQDINYDQLNYHYYAAYAYEHGRVLQDVAPSEVMHSYFSPIVYLPFYYMVLHLPPRMVGMLLGAAQGLNGWLVFCISLLVTRGFQPRARIVAVAATVVISMASPMAISEVGTTMTDVLTSVAVLAGLALLMSAMSYDDRGSSAAAWMAAAGALVGAATSLKLTNASFAIGLAAASLAGWPGWRDRLIAAFAVGIGGVVGFAACGGFWYVYMWQIFGNPVFPYFNNVFRSPDYPADHALFDSSHIAGSFLEALSYPFLWIRSQTTTAESSFRDVRFAVLIILGLLVVGLQLVLRGRVRGLSVRWMPAGQRLMVFVLVSFCVWLYEWSIQRYLVAIELLAGPALLVLLQWLGVFRTPRACAAAAAAVAVVCAVTVRAPDWGHLGWQETWYTVDVPPTASDHPVYFLAGEPLSFVVPALKPGASAIGYVAWEDIPNWGDTIFLRRINALLADRQNDPVQTVSSGPPSDDFRKTIARYGLKIDGDCITKPGRPWPLTWCKLARMPPSS